MAVLIVAEHDNQHLKPANQNLVTAARQLDSVVDIVVAGHTCKDVAKQAAKIDGVRKVIVADQAIYSEGLVENLAPLIKELAMHYSHVLAPATTFGKNLLPRVAALLDVAQISEITAIVDPHTFIRPIYAGNALATIHSTDPIHVITVRPTAFEQAKLHDHETATMEVMNTVHDVQLSRFIKREQSASSRPELTSASVVISGGRGLQSGENFKLLEQLADQLGAAIGASRAAVDAGFVPNDYQVGQTGKIVAPALYIAIGISGAIQHIAGMKDSKVIVAINKDPDAPIFQIADYGLVGDLFEIIPALIAELKVKE